MFLVASTQLYKRVCLSIRPLVRRSVMLSLGGQRLDSQQRMVVYTNLFMTFLHFSRGLGSVPESLSIRNLVTTLACVSVCLLWHRVQRGIHDFQKLSESPLLANCGVTCTDINTLGFMSANL